MFRLHAIARAGLALVALLAGAAAPAAAVLIASGDGTGNTSAPADDPGFANVGSREGLAGIYLGNGWVLTASHVGAGPIVLGGTTYDAVSGSSVQLQTGSQGAADLVLFRIDADPGLPSVSVTQTAPTLGEGLVLIGRGRNRGPATRWRGIDGWEYGVGKTMRWGTNQVDQVPGSAVSIGGTTNRVFVTEFTSGLPTPHESQAVASDSGGVAFVSAGQGWELAGIMLAISTYANQPSQTALYGNLTYHADLSFYEPQIAPVVAVAACSDGIDQDGDGAVDGDDLGCRSADDAFETEAGLACDDGIDNDGDGAEDLADPGCSGPAGATEAPACDDGEDNDGDGLVDAAEDPQCSSPSDGSEAAASACGLLGIAPGALLLAVGVRRLPARVHRGA